MPRSPQPRETHTVTATEAGFLTRMDALPFGIAAWRLGRRPRSRRGPRRSTPRASTCTSSPATRSRAGQPLFTLLGHDGSRFARALEALEGSWEIGSDAPAPRPLVLERITA